MDSYHSCSEAGSEPETPARRMLVPNRIGDLPAVLIRLRQSNEELCRRGGAEEIAVNTVPTALREHLKLLCDIQVAWQGNMAKNSSASLLRNLDCLTSRPGRNR